MTKDVFLCANKSKLTCGDKRECEQFFRRGSIPLQYKIHSIRGIQFILINIAKSKWHFNVSPFKPYWCDPIFYHEIVNFIYKQSEPYETMVPKRSTVFSGDKKSRAADNLRGSSQQQVGSSRPCHIKDVKKIWKKIKKIWRNIKKIWRRKKQFKKKLRCILAEGGGHLQIPVTWKATKKIWKKYHEK